MQNTLQDYMQDNLLSEAQRQHAPSQSKQTLAKLQQIRIEKIRLLYIHSLTPITLSAVAGLFLVAALLTSADHQHLIVWLVTTVSQLIKTNFRDSDLAFLLGAKNLHCCYQHQCGRSDGHGEYVKTLNGQHHY